MNRKQLLAAGVGTLLLGSIVAISVPFLTSLNPSARADARGDALREINIQSLAPGDARYITKAWRGMDVVIVHRSQRQIEMQINVQPKESRISNESPDSNAQEDPAWVDPETRSLDKRYGVYLARPPSPVQCNVTYEPEGLAAIGFVPAEPFGGIWIEPCRGAFYDVTGRIINHADVHSWQGARNLQVPPHRWIGAGTLLLGVSPIEK